MGIIKGLISDYENYFPKEKKEIPKGDEQKSESKGTDPHCLAHATTIYLLNLSLSLSEFFL